MTPGMFDGLYRAFVWALVAAACLGAAIGIGGWTLVHWLAAHITWH